MKRSLLLILFFLAGLYMILGGVSDEITSKINETNSYFEEANSRLEDVNSHLEDISVKVDEANALLSELQTFEGDPVSSSVSDNDV